MATIAYHTLHGTQTVILPEDVTIDDGTVVQGRHLRVPGRRPLLERIQPDQPDRGRGS